jgi:arylsulfatase A-like enzyme
MDRRGDLPDVVLVVFDTARRDRFGAYGYGRRTTPATDSLAAAGLVADRMIANGPWTLPSHASLFTGLYPTEHGAQWQTGRRLNDDVRVTLAELLRDAGYETLCATNNALISSSTGLARGFDRHVHRSDLEGPWSRRARQLRKVAAGGDSGGAVINRWIRRQLPTVRKPLFLFVNYLECHWPYAPPRRLHRLVGGERFDLPGELRYRWTLARRTGPWDAVGTADEETLEVYSALYDAEHRNVDAHLEHLLDMLEGAGRLRPGASIVLVTSDHGEHLGEHGLADHQASLDDHLIRVPFVAWGPGIVRSGRRAAVAEFVDVLPAIADVVGIELPVPYLADRRSDLLSGQDGGANGGGRPAFAEWRAWAPEDLARVQARHPRYDFAGLVRDLACARDERFKFVRAGDGTEAFYDLEADPAEERDVAAAHPADRDRLRSALDAQRVSWASFRTEPSDLSDRQTEEIEQHLSELGYL